MSIRVTSKGKPCKLCISKGRVCHIHRSSPERSPSDRNTKRVKIGSSPSPKISFKFRNSVILPKGTLLYHWDSNKRFKLRNQPLWTNLGSNTWESEDMYQFTYELTRPLKLVRTKLGSFPPGVKSGMFDSLDEFALYLNDNYPELNGYIELSDDPGYPHDVVILGYGLKSLARVY